MYTTCSPDVLSLEFSCTETCNSMNNLLSYCGLVDARISASEKDLPVRKAHFNRPNMILNYCTVIMTTIYIAQYQNKTFLSSQWPSI